ncbi:hypothetical protein MPTK1_5g21100 [Marchantia polymorpha subsp. ruderalis]|uniref:Uncharacterized protein n=2 Tax=Marchantia polymorpha TaxID=3197 RepID=A0AAF6BKM4_MARPO|nr:hypothetical protein MARPO_0058s0092 [Marchantia polymorpha]PTQ37318.1 hypothetical protein MARPO_0058s0092 [Marchantia polymorpha]BBN12557.1 hypothetical protein Mp_5g21100 [Marchantia polymorpha subsp. ruderalis]BBN12558.1 hypothetical protein Mp_5g21100 [Marchantia polymorpha subsp. ruderalis]|eukprot:PTQ37317.1 hypothetical protein MARPO_0058s0092 [Marchantia polymorpha]
MNGRQNARWGKSPGLGNPHPHRTRKEAPHAPQKATALCSRAAGLAHGASASASASASLSPSPSPSAPQPKPPEPPSTRSFPPLTGSMRLRGQQLSSGSRGRMRVDGGGYGKLERRAEARRERKAGALFAAKRMAVLKFELARCELLSPCHGHKFLCGRFSHTRHLTGSREFNSGTCGISNINFTVDI